MVGRAPPRWLDGEPAARQSLEAGADLILFSGDKLFGGPQAGIIAGSSDLVAACAKHPLARALRPGGLVLSALQATTLAYLDRDGQAIPFWRMATAPNDELRARADAIAAVATTASVVNTEAVPGGGTLPMVSIPSVGLSIDGDQTTELRDADRPLIARVDEATTIVDLRTIAPADDRDVAKALAALSGQGADR